MGIFGVWVAGTAIQHALAGTVPEAPVMGAVGALALAANLGVAVLLYRWRDGDSNMRSVWICTRNDAIGNLAVLAAAAGVFGSGGGWERNSGWVAIRSIMTPKYSSTSVAIRKSPPGTRARATSTTNGSQNTRRFLCRFFHHGSGK